MVVVEKLVVRFYMFRDKRENSRGNFGLKMALENISFLFCNFFFLGGGGTSVFTRIYRPKGTNNIS